ncbi:hypothetical protein, partial [Neisseria sp. P0013.S004]|uniref:hypothetical protein n=1 Tax=Neisseria sp. P0013.S004 TaxID=3436740 RepID=UPI003F7F4D5D
MLSKNILFSDDLYFYPIVLIYTAVTLQTKFNITPLPNTGNSASIRQQSRHPMPIRASAYLYFLFSIRHKSIANLAHIL